MVAASTATIATNHGEGERGTDMKADGIILVHGGMHTAACWALVEPMLTLPSRAVDLPGRGSRPAELSHVTLDDCVAAVLEEADSAGFAASG
jgi:hypothetical protein